MMEEDVSRKVFAYCKQIHVFRKKIPSNLKVKPQ